MQLCHIIGIGTGEGGGVGGQCTLQLPEVHMFIGIL